MKYRVYVKTLSFEGWGTIVDYYPNEVFYPIQIELDEPDSDGHSFVGICNTHIVKK